jgi:sulfur relay protein TusD/DsrE
MKIAVMVLEGQAARARGHEILGVFLFTDGVNNANQFISPPGERNIAQRFEQLGAEGIEVVACTACAKFRGMRPNIKVEHVRLSGLGSLAGYLQNADRFVTFGD